MTYKKFKDKSPEDTVNFIINSLHNAGIETVYKFNPKSVDGCYSNRVSVIDASPVGSNGKGTSEIYALASGYAELMERLQNNMFYVGSNDPKLYNESGFYLFPDEKIQKVISYCTDSNSFIDNVYELNCCKSFTDKAKFISKAVFAFNEMWHMEKDDVLTIPFYSVKEHKTIYLPYPIYSKIYGSNGMSAGNTIEEALVQGLSEIYERYVNRFLLENDFTPPDVPRNILKKSKLYEIIERIEESGQYSVIVKDLSLGGNFPVVGTVIIDNNNGSFGFRLGAHPSFEIALERTLTESFQGRSLDNFTSSAEIGTNDEACSESNIMKIFRSGEGYYRSSLFKSEADADYYQFSDVSIETNESLLTKMLKPALDKGYDIIVRNSGFLGLPALQIIIPEMSYMTECTESKIKFYNTVYKISTGLCDEDSFNTENIKRILRLSEYMISSNTVYNMTFVRILSRPLEGLFTNTVYDVPTFLSVLYYRTGNIKAADGILKSVKADECAEEQFFIKALKLYVKLSNDGKSKTEIKAVADKIYGSEISDKVSVLLTGSKKDVMESFGKIKCFDCDNCKVSCCNYKGIYSLMKKLRKAMKNNMPIQENFFKVFSII